MNAMLRFYVVLLIHLPFLFAKEAKEDDYNPQNLTINEIGDRIVNLFHATGKAMNDLQHKIEKINRYVVDNSIVLTNVSSVTDLNETNFFNALNENDHFSFLSNNDSKNLYLKLKAKMTRDDILNIVAARDEKSKLVKSARRMLKGPTVKEDENKGELNDVVDKILGEVPKDNHVKKAKQSIYWDPQGELEDLKEYHEAKRSGRRIFKGERTNIREYPFMASIHIMGRFWCGGALYWHDLVLTSASCLQLMHNNRFYRENPRTLSVRLGSNHSRLGGETIDVLEVFFHPSYDPKSLANNLAVVRLRRHLKFTFRIPKLIAISHLPSTIPATAEITVLGWGVTKMLQKLSFEPIFLQKKVLPVYPNMFCKEVYGDKFITEKMFCAGTLTTGEGACDHDAGGPAILSGQLIGIISFGPSICGFSNTPTVFTLVGAFADWIETVNETMPTYYRAKAPTTITEPPIFNEFFNTWVPKELRASSRSEPLQPIALFSASTYATEPEEEATTTETVKATTTPAPDVGRIRMAETIAAPENNADWSIGDE